MTADPFADMMRGAHLLAAHELPAFIAKHGRAVGIHDALMYLVDLQQQVLVPFLPPDGPEPAERPTVLGIESTLAGRVYQHLEPRSQDDGTGHLRGWVPVLDGADRLGVLAVTVQDAADLHAATPMGRQLRFFAGLVGELVMSKTMYGDTIVRLRRTAPMGLAAEIQWALLPPLTFASRTVSIAAALEPAYEVAGDSVDYSVDQDAARFAVFDGMGHELLSAQLVGLVVAAYRNARRGGLGLVAASEHIEGAVNEVFGGEAFTTGLLAELDTATGVLTWVNAGHPAPLLLRHGRRVKTLELEPRLPFGMSMEGPAVFGAPLEVHVGSEHLEPGDHVLLYTDGVVEARSPEGELFGADRLTDLLIRNLAAGLPTSETMRRAVTALLHHQGSDLVDDATLLLAQWRPEHPEGLLP